jgi:hypothetical protein
MMAWFDDHVVYAYRDGVPQAHHDPRSGGGNRGPKKPASPFPGRRRRRIISAELDSGLPFA